MAWGGDRTPLYSASKTRDLIAWLYPLSEDTAAHAARELKVDETRLRLGDRLGFDEIERGIFKTRGFDAYAFRMGDILRMFECARAAGFAGIGGCLFRAAVDLEGAQREIARLLCFPPDPDRPAFPPALLLLNVVDVSNKPDAWRPDLDGS